jgi:hypothetical protein
MRPHFTWIPVALVAAAVGVVEPVGAQQTYGIIAFRDDCTRRLYAMRADGSGRVALPLPALPLPTDRYTQPVVLDVTTSGPLTVVYSVGIARTVVVNGQNTSVLVDQGIFAVQLNEIGGVLTPDPEIRLGLPATAGVDPNRARRGSFSPLNAGDRLALAVDDDTTSVLMIAKVDRDDALRIVGLSDVVLLGDLSQIGLFDPGFPTEPGFTGGIDYTPDGTGIVASIDSDLWMIHLHSDGTYLGAERLTDTARSEEWNPAVSPDGASVAYTGAAIDRNGRASSNSDLYTLEIGDGDIVRVTHNKNKGAAASGRNNAMWSVDAAWIGFSAYTGSPKRGAPCSDLLDSEIFSIRSDGSSVATPITTTRGTGVEVSTSWGW